jgi:hypothetical protein
MELVCEHVIRSNQESVLPEIRRGRPAGECSSRFSIRNVCVEQHGIEASGDRSLTICLTERPQLARQIAGCGNKPGLEVVRSGKLPKLPGKQSH